MIDGIPVTGPNLFFPKGQLQPSIWMTMLVSQKEELVKKVANGEFEIQNLHNIAIFILGTGFEHWALLNPLEASSLSP